MFDFGLMLHEERSNCLRRLPEFDGTVLSAGCAGSWYFDWFSNCTGHVGRHIGLELYSPKPPDLPPNVEWIVNSVEDMAGVLTAEVDLVFSGQNVEHLSASSLYGFMLEANRVLKDGGLLIVDSPNRAVTLPGYTHPEHSLELTVPEMVQLLAVSGFDVLDVQGIWLVVDPKTNETMAITNCDDGSSYEARKTGAFSDPKNSFIWWINSRKTRPPDAERTRQFVNDLFWRCYNGFVSARYGSLVGSRTWNWGSTAVALNGSEVGYALFGPYIPLAPGKYAVCFSIYSDENSGQDLEIVLDVISGQGALTHGRRELTCSDFKVHGWSQYQVVCLIPHYVTGTEARCHVSRFKGAVMGGANFLALP